MHCPVRWLFHAGRCLVFVALTAPGDDGPTHLLALVHKFVCVRSDSCFDVESLVHARHRLIALSHMKFAFKRTAAHGALTPVVDLVPTEALSSAVWTNEDFDFPGHHWFIRTCNNDA